MNHSQQQIAFNRWKFSSLKPTKKEVKQEINEPQLSQVTFKNEIRDEIK